MTDLINKKMSSGFPNTYLNWVGNTLLNESTTNQAYTVMSTFKCNQSAKRVHILQKLWVSTYILIFSLLKPLAWRRTLSKIPERILFNEPKQLYGLTTFDAHLMPYCF